MNTKLVESLADAVSALEPAEYKLFQSLLPDSNTKIAQQTPTDHQSPHPVTRDWCLKDYNAMTKVCQPRESGDQTLFMVRVPDNFQTLTESEYTALIKLRVMWMMQEWLTYEVDDKRKLQSVMTMGLLKLHPGQIEPRLPDDEDDEYDCFEEWASEWADCLIDFNSRWQEWCFVINSEVEFPVDLTPECFTEMDCHDEVTIENFFAYLASPFERL